MSDTRIKLIAFDLDGTILTSDKRITERTINALKAAAERGIHIVPATGRYYNNVPEVLRNLDFIDYAILINGAYVSDIKKDICVFKAEMDPALVVGMMEFLDDYPVLYAATIDNGGWVTKSVQDRADEYASGYYVESLQKSFVGVDDLKKYVKELNHPVQKLQFYMQDIALKEKLGELLKDRFPEVIVTSSLNQNIEINDIHANKGEALLKLAEYIGIKQEETMAIGDGRNDIPMIKAAGYGVAMINGRPELKALADSIAPHHNEEGVAVAIEEILK